tara:strand:- start:130 stop:801 length:672 start_codon:yes stop_codon:yes gene_type:complete
MINYKHKIRLLRFIRKIFKFFNFKIFYSKDVNYLKDLNVKNIIDVGVAHGTKELLYNFPKAYFYFIEPNPVFWSHIEEVLLKKFNGKLYKTAAGNSTGILDFYNFGNTSSFLQRKDYELKNKIKVNLDKLDNIISPNNLENTLLKIDVEGYELEVLKGSCNILDNVDYCIVELRLQNIDTYNPSELINYLYEKNFYFHKIIKVYYVKYGIDFMDVLFIKKSLI